MSNLKVGIFISNYQIEDLHLDADVNRETSVSNIEEKKNKLEENNWLMPIVITSTGKVLEGQNRLVAAKSLGLDTIPVYVADWIDDENVDEVRDVIISLNNGNKAWTQWDYIKSFKSSKVDYAKAYANCVKYEKTLTNGNVVNAMFGIGSMNTRFKEGKSKLISQEKYSYLLETCSALVGKFGKTQFPSQTLRTLILWGISQDDYGVINYVVNQMKTSVSNGVRVQDGDLGLKEWINEQVKTYNNVVGLKKQ